MIFSRTARFALLPLAGILGWMLLTGGAHAEPRRGTPPTTSATATADAPAEGKQPATDGHPATVDDKLSVTHHQITLDGRALKYEATAGTMMLKDEAGKPRASFFFVAYRAEPGADFDPTRRPITYVFNGGPGAAAVWLHLGGIGPRHLPLDENGDLPTTPPAVVDNPNTWLDLTDLVFIDPVGTGYSRPAPGVKAEEFFGVENDLASVASFIRLYTTRYDRWLSPKFLAGESYGTTRAAGLSSFLLEREGISLNGIVFISTVLDFQTLMSSGSNDLPYQLFLPSYTAAAWYHKKLAPDLQHQDLQKVLAEVQPWASTEYVGILAAGASLKPEQRDAAIQRLARYTSLSPDFIRKSRLRIEPGIFRKMLLNDSEKIIGRFDDRLTGDDPDPASNDRGEYDPGFSPFFAAYTSAFTDYARRTLKYESDLPYGALNGVGPWSFGRDGHGYLNVSNDLQSALMKNPRMKLLFCSGYYDLATPWLGTDYTLNHMNLAPALRANISRAFYPAGHMLYHPKATSEKLKKDVSGFMRGALGAPATRPAR